MSELKNPERELYLFRRRLALAGTIVVIAFMALLGRFMYLQVAMQGHYATLAESNRISLVPVVPNRGVITDRNGIVLAQSYSAYTLEVTPSKVKNLEDTIEQLSTVVEITSRDRKRFRKLLDESKNFEHAAAHATDRSGGREIRRQSLPVSRRDQGAAVPASIRTASWPRM
jgi:penicillin-binding protein 2